MTAQRVFSVLLFVFCLGAAPLFAEPTAEEIIKNVDEVRSPQMDYTTTVEVESFSPSGPAQKSVYEVLVKGNDETVVKTIAPAFERGRILLMRDRNLWAFFPNVSKPLRLSLQERLNGEVSNGDIARVNLSGDYVPKLIKTRQINGKKCFCLELTANSPEVTYGKVLIWVESDSFWPLKARFFAISGRLLKSCSYENYVMLAGRLRPSRLVLEDPIVHGKKSIITYSGIKIEELPEKYFTKDYMKKFME